MNATKYMSQMGYAVLHEFERGPNGGVALVPYQGKADRPGVLTIGWGHVIKRGESFTSITPAQADQLLANDVREFEQGVRRVVKVALKQCQFDALVCFAFNVGMGGGGADGLGTSTLLRKLNAGDFRGAHAEFARWNKAAGQVQAGLTRRRTVEAALFAKDGL